MEFEWDEDKARANVVKHGVSFEEAATVFDDLFNVIFRDDVHSDEEERFFLLGLASTGRILTVCYTEREGKTRLITARPATRNERRHYEENND